MFVKDIKRYEKKQLSVIMKDISSGNPNAVLVNAL